MKDFLSFIKSIHFFLLFLLLELISIFFVVRNNEKAFLFINSANVVSGFFHARINNISDYFSLQSENSKLAEENKRLRTALFYLKQTDEHYLKRVEDYGLFYKSAKVVKNSINKPHNILTVDKGRSQGIVENMAVVSSGGIVGITAVVGKNYATVISVLNTKVGFSAKIKRTNYHGIAKWDGTNPEYVLLTDIPVYSSLQKGDTVITGGYSAIFPEGLKIGTVAEFSKDTQSTFYNIKVKLEQDFRKLNHVYLIDRRGSQEIIPLEDSTNMLYRFSRHSL